MSDRYQEEAVGPARRGRGEGRMAEWLCPQHLAAKTGKAVFLSLSSLLAHHEFEDLWLVK